MIKGETKNKFLFSEINHIEFFFSIKKRIHSIFFLFSHLTNSLDYPSDVIIEFYRQTATHNITGKESWKNAPTRRTEEEEKREHVAFLCNFVVSFYSSCFIKHNIKKTLPKCLFYQLVQVAKSKIKKEQKRHRISVPYSLANRALNE
jgi:hypothetical protein